MPASINELDNTPEGAGDSSDWILRRARAGRAVQPTEAPPVLDQVFELEAPEGPALDEDEEELARAIQMSLEESMNPHPGRMTPAGTDLDQLEEAIARSKLVM